MTTWRAAQLMNYLEHRLVRDEKFPEITKDERIILLEALRRAHSSLYKQWNNLPIDVQVELLKINNELETYNLEKK